MPVVPQLGRLYVLATQNMKHRLINTTSQTTSHQGFKSNLCLFFLFYHIKLPCAEGNPTKKNTANNSKFVFIFSLGEILLLHSVNLSAVLST